MIKPSFNKDPMYFSEKPTTSALLADSIKKITESSSPVEHDKIEELLTKQVREFRTFRNEILSKHFISKDYDILRSESTIKEMSELEPIRVNTKYNLNISETTEYPDFFSKLASKTGGRGLDIRPNSELIFFVPKDKVNIKIRVRRQHHFGDFKIYANNSKLFVKKEQDNLHLNIQIKDVIPVNGFVTIKVDYKPKYAYRPLMVFKTIEFTEL